MADFKGKVALVTGGARRVGKAIALGLAESGCNLVIHYNRSADEAEAVGPVFVQGGCDD